MQVILRISQHWCDCGGSMPSCWLWMMLMRHLCVVTGACTPPACTLIKLLCLYFEAFDSQWPAGTLS